MRFVKSLVSIFLIFTLFSCLTTEEESVNLEVQDEEISESSIEKKMVEKKIEEIKYFVLKEEAFYGDGQVDTITTYTYDDDFNLVSKVQSNEQGESLESYINTIENGVVIRRDNLGFLNKLNNYVTYVYENDLVVSETMFDDENKPQSTNEYEYVGTNVKNWKTLGPSGGLLAITEYEYDSEGNNTKVIMKDGLGSVDGTIEKTYKDGMIIEEKVLDSKGKSEKTTQYIYDGEILVEKAFFNSRGKKSRSETYEFEPGVPVPSKVYLLYNSGEVEAYTTYEYETKVEVTTIMVEE